MLLKFVCNYARDKCYELLSIKKKKEFGGDRWGCQFNIKKE